MDTNQLNREIEVRFLGIDKDAMKKKLMLMGATDLGEELLQETIFYDTGRTWLKDKKMVRLRKTPTKQVMTFKHNERETLEGTTEIELPVDDLAKAKAFLEALGLKAFRLQEKKRHTFLWDGVSITLDEHPGVPVYLEIEGSSEQVVRDTARAMELDWNRARFESSRDFIENIYGIPLSTLKTFTFSKIE